MSAIPLYGGHFLSSRGIDPEVWYARGCRRYEQGDLWVKDEFRPFLPSSRLGTVTRIVNQSPGWIMPKHSPPGFSPIPPQLRPDNPVTLDQRTKWHYHRERLDEWPVFPEAAGKSAGKPLPRRFVMWGAAAESHLNAQGAPYDIATGEGAHNGVNIDVVHPHAPHEAKYVLLGEGRRIDLHPWALDRLRDAVVVFFVLEGCPKNDAVLSAGGPVFSVPSVTCWDRRELIIFARRHLDGKTVFIVPDADWVTNGMVIRQALKVRTLLRRRGVDAYCAAPPFDGFRDHDIKGVDDYLGAGGHLGGLEIAGWEPPLDRIREVAANVDYHRRRKTIEALENLSLYAQEDGTLKVGFPTLKRLLDIRDPRRVLPTLDAIREHITVVSGTLETEIREIRTDNGTLDITMWKDTPTMSLDEQVRAQQTRRRILVEDFYRDASVDRLTRRVEELERLLEERKAA